MFEYEMQQSRHAELVEEAAQARLARQARQAAKSAGARRGDKKQMGAVRSLRSHFTRAA
ncbi:hypothetical protein ACH4SP_32895 [Streptomyces sp. NPDC021093]|uniref:hypothetical protein n=1 Tax=Streptomyces sp. NPDC021093 TaxID=3365112 RepID=UPI0037B5ADDB